MVARSVPVVLSLLIAVAMLPSVTSQATEAPAFVVGANKLYCHATEDSLTVWMNALVDDGFAGPYQPTGEAAFTDPALGVGFDPVAQEAVEIRIPLTPALGQTIVVKGTVTVQAFIGSGAYGGGAASLAASLVAGTTVLGASEAVDHTMTPKNANVPDNPATGPGTGPYDEIGWTFDVPETPIPAGTPLEWVISGTIEFGNNVFLACHEARGRSNIDVPVAALDDGSANAAAESASNTTTNTTTTSSTSSSASSTTRATSSTTTAASSTTAGNSTTPAAEEDTEDAPGLPMLATGLALLAVALVLRRRLA